MAGSACGGNAVAGSKPARLSDLSSAEKATLMRPSKEPPLTPAPPAQPDLIEFLDLSALVRGMTSGTSVKLNVETVLAVGAFPEAGTDGPLLLIGYPGSAKGLIAWPVVSAPKLQAGVLEPVLTERGWSSFGVPRCAWHEGKAHGIVACGASDVLAAATDSVLAAFAQAQAVSGLELRFNLQELARAAGATEMRADVPNRVDALLRSTALDESVPLRLALHDLGFDLAGRLQASLTELTSGSVQATFDPSGSEHYELQFEPAMDTVLGSAIAHARSARIPKAVLELPFETQTAFYADSSLLAPFLTPGRRARDLLARVQGEDPAGGLARALEGAFSSCITPNRMVYLAEGSQPKGRQKSPKPPKESEKVSPKKREGEAQEETSFTIYGFEDTGAQCGAALGAVARAYASAGDSKQAVSERKLELLSPTLVTPRPDWMVRVGTGSEQTFFASLQRDGWTQILQAATLVELKAALTSLVTARARRRTLAARPELSPLSARELVLGGFASERAVRPSFALLPWLAPKEGSDERIAVSLAHEQGSRFALTGDVTAEKARVVAAQLLVSMFDHMDWVTLGAPQRAALVTVLDSSCRVGYGPACNILGVRYGDGNQVEKNIARAHELLGLGCELNSAMACANLAFYGSAPSEVIPLLKKSCDLHAVTGCAWYGARLISSNKPEDHGLAISKLEFACNLGSGFGCGQLAYAYRNGVGIGKDDEKATELSERACELRHATDCVWLGNAFAEGVGRKKDPGSALDAYKRACELDKRDGCYALGMAYLAGTGTEKDIGAAKRELATACDAGHAESCRVLAELTEEP